MSITFHVFLRRERMPTAQQWAAAIREFRFGTQMDPSFDLTSFSGYLPCPDDLTGFELYVEPFSNASFEIGPTGIEAVAGRGTMITFRFSGREADMTAAIAAAASLAAMADGVLFDSESGHFVDAGSALAWARDEEYTPIAIYRTRARKRRSRVGMPIIVRLLILFAIVASLVFFWR